jgi:hypothetical protein
MRGVAGRLVAVAAVVTLAGLVAGAQAPDGPVRLTGWAVSMGTVAPGANATVEIVVDRWSTETERESLIKSFVEKGPKGLLNALQDSKKVGYIRYPASMAKYWGLSALGYDLRFARQVPGEDGGRRIIVATDRYIGFQEASQQPRTIDYPFTLIEIRLKNNGQGEGKLSMATKIELNKKDKTIEIENYSSEPVRLQNVKAEPKK